MFRRYLTGTLAVAVALVMPMAVMAAGEGEESAGASAATMDAAPTEYNEAPMLAARVAAGELPPVDQRLGNNPLVTPVVESIGRYGGEWFRVYTGAADIYCNSSKVNGWGPWRFTLDGESVTEYFVESWSVSDDGTTWTLTIRDGIMWSDGTPVTTEDARYAIEDWYTHDMTMGEGKIQPPRWLKGPSASPAELQIVDDSTFTLVYDKAYYYLPRQSSGGCPGGTWEMLMPAHYMKQFHAAHNADAAKAATEAGFEDWVTYYNEDRARLSRNPDRPTITPWVYLSLPGDQVYRLERNPYYFSVDPAGNQLPYIDTIAMELVSDREVLNLKLMQGEIDFQHRHVRFGNFPVLKDNEQKSDYRVVEGPTATYGDYVAINQTYAGPDEDRALLQNYDFRLAVATAINRDRINEVITLGEGNPDRYFLPPQGHAYHPGDQYETLPYSHDPAEANRILDTIMPEKDSEGFRLRPDGAPFTLLMTHWLNDPEALRMELIADDLAQVGLRVKYDLLERSLSVTKLTANEYMMHVGYFNIDEGDFLVAHWIAPVVGPHTPLYAPGWTAWVLDNSKGEEPPADVKSILVEPFLRGPGLTPDEGAEVMRNAFQWHYENLVLIPVNGSRPGLTIASNRLGNVPDGAFSTHATGSPYNHYPDQYYFKN